MLAPPLLRALPPSSMNERCGGGGGGVAAPAAAAAAAAGAGGGGGGGGIGGGEGDHERVMVWLVYIGSIVTEPECSCYEKQDGSG
jgi:hypothetical protein